MKRYCERTKKPAWQQTYQLVNFPPLQTMIAKMPDQMVYKAPGPLPQRIIRMCGERAAIVSAAANNESDHQNAQTGAIGAIVVACT